MIDRAAERAGSRKTARFHLGLISTAALLGMSAWFAASAAGPALAGQWGLTPSAVGGLTTAVQLGFVTGTLAAAGLGLADRFPSHGYFAVAAACAALANASLLVAGTYPVALAGRFLTGACLAGVYPPAMKMTATWFRSNRGVAIGFVVGGLTIGKALPYLVEGSEVSNVATIVVATSLAALLAAGLVGFGYRDGPFAFERRPFRWGQVAEVVGDPKWRLATGGYLGHMWELYAFWTWIATFLAVVAARPGGTGPLPEGLVAAAPFLVIAVGAIGCVWGGLVADRIGYERLTMLALAVSGSCAVLSGVLAGASLVVILPLALVWGFFVVADSAQFSATVTEVVPRHVVGTALTLQVALGFLLTMVTIQLVPIAVERAGWHVALPILALGPAGGIASMARLRTLRSSGPPCSAS